ncbi:OsmC family protein [Nocardioides sp. LHG3406-4]|uniref:OsmC family protein n=1 Tax=Nocardioides sp. LHG3406-4 TaxID=2804575 RepID=UPI003CF07B0C
MTDAVPPTPQLTDETLRSIDLTRIGEGRFKATNARGGETFIGGGGDDPDFTPVELLLAAIAGCSAADIDAITRKRAEPSTFDMVASGHKIRDEHGNHLVGLRVTVDIAFPEGEAGDAARTALPRAVAQTRDRLCTVGRTVALGEPIEYVDVSAGDAGQPPADGPAAPPLG